SPIRYFRWDVAEGTIDKKAFENIDAIIHLAGANVGDKRWTEKRKREILHSRTDSTQLLFRCMEERKVKIKKFISASAIGYYGTTTSETIFNENSEQGKDFLADVCSRWENEVRQFEKQNLYPTILRTAVVLARNSGALQKMAFPAKLGLNAALGTGNQYMPWIHIEDLCMMYLFFLKNPGISGVFNAVATEHVHNRTFLTEVSSVLKKPFFMPNVPAFFLRMLFGEMSDMLLEGSRVNNEKVRQQGFIFKHGNLNGALTDLFAP
ncbi:MAG: TIGR01777 family oxidoreductase, partial [Flavobacteriales bacterium]|nr:TIGR01777 family oxidoreductase [Flavobacteriales bacterium]